MKNFYTKLYDYDYKTKLPYDSFSSIDKKNIEKDVETNFAGTMAERKAEAERRIAEEKAKKDEIKNAHDADSNRLYEQFKADLFDYYKVTGNPKVEKAFDIAWEYGHSSGYSEVASYFSNIVELIKD